MWSLPLEVVTVVNVSVDESRARALLLSEVLRLERPAFESQTRAVEADAFAHQLHIHRENVSQSCV